MTTFLWGSAGMLIVLVVALFAFRSGMRAGQAFIACQLYDAIMVVSNDSLYRAAVLDDLEKLMCQRNHVMREAKATVLAEDREDE